MLDWCIDAAGVGLAGLAGLFAWFAVCRNWPAIAEVCRDHGVLLGEYGWVWDAIAWVSAGEAWPTGGLGLAKQMKDELRDCPPVLVLIARRPDA